MNPTLEALIDANGLDIVLSALAMICSEKADHIESTYNDSNLAESWNKCAAAILNAEMHVKSQIGG